MRKILVLTLLALSCYADKKIEISEMSDLHLSFENFENKLDNTR